MTTNTNSCIGRPFWRSGPSGKKRVAKPLLHLALALRRLLHGRTQLDVLVLLLHLGVNLLDKVGPLGSLAGLTALAPLAPLLTALLGFVLLAHFY